MWATVNALFKWGDSVAVNSAGCTGNILLNDAIRSGASRVNSIDTVHYKLDIALKLGSTHKIEASEVDPAVVINELTKGEGVDVAVVVIGGIGIGLVQAHGMVGYSIRLALYGNNYGSIKDFCFQPSTKLGWSCAISTPFNTPNCAPSNICAKHSAWCKRVFSIRILFFKVLELIR